MSTSNFGFIRNSTLRQNLDEAFDHILVLLPLSESSTYDETSKSLFRKTIVIYTASIIEALLFSVLDTNFTDSDISNHFGSWKLKNEKTLFVKEDGSRIVAGDYCWEKSKTGKNKMNLDQIANFLKEKSLITKKAYQNICIVRDLRNEQHIGSRDKVKTYSKNELEQAFSVAKDVKRLVSST